MDIKLNNSWQSALNAEFEKPYFKSLTDFLDNEYANTNYEIYPPEDDVFNAFKLTDLNDVKVVILGQDPYHGKNQAHGLSFSVLPSCKIPKSLINIYKELHEDTGFEIPDTGYLKKWAEQGVFLLNTLLTVKEGEPKSHKGKGWERFTDEVIKILNSQERPVVYMLWGREAQSKIPMLTNPKHKILCAAHPSPFSAKNFRGCRHFSKANEFLSENGLSAIDWQI